MNDVTAYIDKFAQALVYFINMVKDFFAKLTGAMGGTEAE